jgi:hypothetical protein
MSLAILAKASCSAAEYQVWHSSRIEHGPLDAFARGKCLAPSRAAAVLELEPAQTDALHEPTPVT